MNATGPDPKAKAKGPGASAVLIFGAATLVAFVASHERDPTRPTVVYLDKLAKKTAQFPNGLPTNCSGLTPYITDTPFVVGEDWGKEKCDREDAKALMRVQHTLVQCFTLPPPQSVFDMATDHAWNFGVSATCSSSAMRAWNAGDWKLGCQRLQFKDDGRPAWSYAGGKLVRGLFKRRGDEVAYCLRGIS